MSSTVNEQPPPDAAAHDAAGARERFDAARRRLRAAFEALDAAISRRAERALEQADQLAEYSALQDDRSRLALELDAAARRARALEAANLEAARRIERAAAAVRAVLTADTHQSERSAYAGASTPKHPSSFRES
ncbi:DUF4164 family protein [Rhodoblastus sp.]|uniref:DUF4164 family protein n=1 Tax=Rhodoblastus sp. TaxID=1962975 RepID=UPI00262A7E49|nr:DUF4164 family protein [Rhodoblastus sp.]